MDREHLAVLADAVRIQQRKEDLERAIGRSVRNAKKSFGFYVEIMSELRELAKSKNVDLDGAAKSLLADNEHGGDEGDQ